MSARRSAKRSNSACSVSASSAAVGSSSINSSGSSRMNPRASASFCHCPKLTSDALVPRRSQLRVEAVRQAVDHVVGAGPTDGAARRAPILDVRAGRRRRRSAGRATRSGRSPGTRRRDGRAIRPWRCLPGRSPSIVIRPDVGEYMPASSLTKRRLCPRRSRRRQRRRARPAAAT